LSRNYRRFFRSIVGRWYQKDLKQLACVFHSDKWSTHWYAQHYEKFFQPIRKKRLNVLEIGVGGYEQLDKGGASLRMWKTYFPNSRIVGIDVYDKTGLSEPRIDIRHCDQTDAEGLRKISDEYGGFDIVIDDGSHVSEHVIRTFHILFPLLRENGVYAIEDTQTAYWTSFGGGVDKPDNTMEFLKRLVDGINYEEIPNREPSRFDQQIVAITFFHNLAIILKGQNKEGSNEPGLVVKEAQEQQGG